MNNASIAYTQGDLMVAPVNDVKTIDYVEYLLLEHSIGRYDSEGKVVYIDPSNEVQYPKDGDCIIS